MNAATNEESGREVAEGTQRDTLEFRLVRLSHSSRHELKNLCDALASEDSDSERIEIARTIAEVLFPESLNDGQCGDDEAEVAAARAELNHYRQSVGLRIRRQRELLHWSQDRLAEAAGIPQSHISCIENGKHVPTFVTIERIAHAFDVPPSFLDPGFADDE